MCEKRETEKQTPSERDERERQICANQEREKTEENKSVGGEERDSKLGARKRE